MPLTLLQDTVKSLQASWWCFSRVLQTRDDLRVVNLLGGDYSELSVGAMEGASQAPHLHHHHRKRRRGWEKGPYVRVHYENLSKASLDHLQNLLSSWSSWESTQTPFAEREGQEEHQSTRLSGTDVYFPSSGPSSAAVPSVLSRLGPLGSRFLSLQFLTSLISRLPFPFLSPPCSSHAA
ncbi:unnamed protein product, partial [Closterium sp. NIES-65]